MVTILANSIKNNTPVLQLQDELKCEYLEERALIIDEREYGSEHREVVTILAKSVKNRMPVLQIFSMH